MQVASRIWVLWGIVWLVPVDTTTGSLPALGPLSPTFTSLVIAWALSEIFRYGFFAAKVMPLGWKNDRISSYDHDHVMHLS